MQTTKRQTGLEAKKIILMGGSSGLIDTNLWNSMTAESRAGLYDAMEKTLCLKGWDRRRMWHWLLLPDEARFWNRSKSGG